MPILGTESHVKRGAKYSLRRSLFNIRYSIFICCCALVLLCSLFAPVCWAVDVRPIDGVRQKDVLDEKDFEIIEQFVRDAIDELVNTVDFTQVARLRAIIVTRQSEQAQYAEQYSKYLRKYIGEAFVKTEELEDATRRHRVRVNLTVLVSQLENPRLIDIALGALEDRDESVRYWAVRALTSRRLIQKVETTSGSPVVDKIASKFEGIVEAAEPEVLRIIADFSAVGNSEQTENLLLKIADMRIKGYSDWTATASPVDMKVLKLLCEKLQSNDGRTAEFGERFAQLYSYVMQKYIAALRSKDLPDEEQSSRLLTEEQQLASILVEIEDKCIGRLTGLQQMVIKRAVELNDDRTLFLEHGRLLGDATRRGEIPAKFGFDYGAADDGSRLMQPRELPQPPTESK
jgi:hypothetical protein